VVTPQELGRVLLWAAVIGWCAYLAWSLAPYVLH
jgi:hypothetical protein